MSERKWTPGPWTWVKPEGWPDHGWREVSLGGFEAGAVTICEFGNNTWYYPSEGEPPNEANAHLIAAAPDLYEALDDLANAALTGDDSHEWIARAFDALAKARGEA